VRALFHSGTHSNSRDHDIEHGANKTGKKLVYLGVFRFESAAHKNSARSTAQK